VSRDLARTPWYRWFIDRLFWRLLRGARLKSGPLAFECRNSVYFLSWRGVLYRITDEGQDYLVVVEVDHL
jgi:hypothetical protein